MATRKPNSVQEAIEYSLVLGALDTLAKELMDVYEGFSAHLRHISDNPQTQYALGVITGFDDFTYGSMPYGKEDLEAIASKVEMISNARETITNPTSESTSVQESVSSLEENLQQAIYKLVGKKMWFLYQNVEDELKTAHNRIDGALESLHSLRHEHDVMEKAEEGY